MTGKPAGLLARRWGHPAGPVVLDLEVVLRREGSVGHKEHRGRPAGSVGWCSSLHPCRRAQLPWFVRWVGPVIAGARRHQSGRLGRSCGASGGCLRGLWIIDRSTRGSPESKVVGPIGFRGRRSVLGNEMNITRPLFVGAGAGSAQKRQGTLLAGQAADRGLKRRETT
jgi:hypothetical protein